MTRILAIAIISLRSAVRSRVVLLLLAVLLLTIIGLPMTIKGDGTVLGTAQVMLTYPLSLVTLILSIVTLWAGCAAISQEVSERYIHLVVSKPVGRFQVWAGKWVGLLLLNAGLLALSGAVVTGLMYWKTGQARYTAAEQDVLAQQVLVARERVGPRLPDVRDEARQLLQQQIEAGVIPPGMSEKNGIAAMARVIYTRRYNVPAGYGTAWTFDIGKPPADRPLHLRYRFSTSGRDDTKIDGRWSFGAPGVSAFDQEVRNAPQGFHTIVVPPGAVDSAGVLQARFTNRNPMELAVVFDPLDGIAVLVYRGSFVANLARALLIIFCHIALLAAIGVSAGALFSMPVASLVAVFVMVMLHSIRYVQSLSTGGSLFSTNTMVAGSGIGEWLLGLVFKFMNLVLSPLQTSNPLDLVGTGLLVPWASVGTVFVIKLVIYSGLIGLVGAALFNRRELGLPS